MPDSEAQPSERRERLGAGSKRVEERLAQLDAWEVEWVRPDRRYLTYVLLSDAIGGVITTAVLSVPLIFVLLGWWTWPWLWLAILVPAISLVWTVIAMMLAPRRARARGYAEREDDLLIRHGILWQKVSAIPYGRLQQVAVSVGPIERALGIASVDITTASSSTDGSIKGIAAQDAARLREELTRRGDDRLAGL